MVVVIFVTVFVASVRGQECPRHIFFCPELFARQVFLAVHPNIDFGRRDPAANDPRNLQPRTHIQRRNSFFKQPWRNSGVNKRAEEHVAADARKALDVGDAHEENRRWRLVVGRSPDQSCAGIAAEANDQRLTANDRIFIIGNASARVKPVRTQYFVKITVSSTA